jgi:hypothetical protein
LELRILMKRKFSIVIRVVTGVEEDMAVWDESRADGKVF